MANRTRTVRRGLHMLFALSLLYYWVPDPLPGLGVSKPLAAMAGVAVVAAMEAWRIRRGWVSSLFRDYERRWVAGYFWLGAGCVLALVAFPQRLAVPAILGTTLIDPLMGEVRARGGDAAARVVGWSAWILAAASASAAFAASTPGPLLLAGATAAAAAEGRRIPGVDDDFLMTAAPLAAMASLAAAAGL